MNTRVRGALEPIETVTLEFLRPGPSHGQLLSPLTPYMALCGDEGPVTLRIELEHWKLVNRLHRLRYMIKDTEQNSIEAVPDRMRESEVLELGDEVGRILADVPTLASELGRAAGRLTASASQESGFVHLRLITSGSELALIPFELAISPEGYPGDGMAMMLQTRTPVIITREVRRGRPATIDWNRSPKVLFVAASPAGLSVPQKAHLHAIRSALDPWITWAPASEPQKRLSNVKQRITVLLNASVEDIENACRAEDYTHVHILAHGDTYDEAGQARYGVALHDDSKRARKRVVDGKRLAEALLASRDEKLGRSRPLVVTLATCDSGNVGSVVVPGGSIAHDLHSAGIPWVFASQFPLTVCGSVRMTEQLYAGLFLGEDPRRLLYRLRASMHVAGRNDHDWASIVAYASVPDDLDHQVHWFRSKQMRGAIEVELARAVLLEKQKDSGGVNKALEAARAWTVRWEEGLPRGSGEVVRSLRGECYGVCGATEKRAAEIFFKRAEQVEHPEVDQGTAKETLEHARTWYRRAMGSRLAQLQHWPAAQYLSLTAVLDKGADRDIWVGTFTWARQDLEDKDVETVAWAHGTLAELEMLRTYHDPTSIKNKEQLTDTVLEHCREIVELMGSGSFHVFSTKRQFERYQKWWRDKRWDDIAEAAVEELSRHSGVR